MELFVCAQDIQSITFGLVRDQEVLFEKTYDASPEHYLFSLEQFFSEQKMSPADVSRILVVTGPGSFTASRVSVTMVNTFAFVHSVPVVSFENSERLSLAELLSQKRAQGESVFAVPTYDRPPNIT
jgi:tRNA A37 threonylcarbamoyladenosine modification protein TsaB